MERALLVLLDNIDRRRYKVDIIFMKMDGQLLDAIPKDVTLVDIGLSGIEESFLNTKGGRDILRSLIKKPSWTLLVLCARYLRYRLTSSEFAKYFAVLYSRKKVCYDIVLDFHGYCSLSTAFAINNIDSERKYTWLHYEDLANVFSVYEAELKEFSAIFCVSNFIKGRIEEKVGPQKIPYLKTFYNFVDVDQIKRKALNDSFLQLPGKKVETRLVTVGRMVKEKGFDLAVKAAKIMKQNELDFLWIFVGDGPLRKEVEAMILAEGLSGCVYCYGYTDNPYSIVHASDIYVCSSRSEGYPVVLNEASVLGKYIVSTDCSGAREHLERFGNGTICEIDPKSISDAICKVIRTNSFRTILPLDDRINAESRIMLESIIG